MDSQRPQPMSGRQTVVTVALTSMAVLFFVFLLVLISGGFALVLVGILAAMVAFGAFHYVLWGRLLVEQTAGESEEEELRQRALADNLPETPDERFHR